MTEVNLPRDEWENPLFKWETLSDCGPFVLRYQTPIPGRSYEIELVGGVKIRVWRGDDCFTYFCHGLTFGGIDAPGGPLSPFSGVDVNSIIGSHFITVRPESGSKRGDILVWQGLDGNTPHSAILLEPRIEPGRDYLAYSAILRTKNGIEPEASMTLEQLILDYYGENYLVYRRKQWAEN